ncbi:MAG: alpha/beta hydrolase [Pseudomonadota bacterium]
MLAPLLTFSKHVNLRNPPIGQTVSVGGVKVHYAVAGPVNAPVLVLLHGASGNLLDWTTSAAFEALTRDWRVIAMDRPGYGHSDPAPREGWMIRPQVDVLQAAMAAIGHRRYAILGHSYGVAVALDWARAFPDEVSGILAMSGAMENWDGALGWRYRWGGIPAAGRAMSAMVPFVASPQLVLRELAEVFHPQPVPDDYVRRAGVELALRPGTFALNLRAMDALHAQTMAFLSLADQVLCPCEVLHGAADVIIPYDSASRPVAALVPGAHTIVLEGIGHMPHHIAAVPVLDALDRLKERITGM